MFEESRQIPSGSELHSEVCIIGGGPVAIAMALHLARAGHEILILPGGGWQEEKKDRDRYRGLVDPAASHEPLEENRRRMWGGTGTVWGGRCVPYDPIDYEARPWIPSSGWPISPNEAELYMGEALQFCEAGSGAFDAGLVFPDAPREILPGFDNSSWSTRSLERWSPPTDFAQRYRKEFGHSKKIKVLLQGQATHLQLHRDGARLQHVQAAAYPGHRFLLRASAYVLACGGLENPRLLLASRDIHTNGIGNQHDQLGRYYQSHLFGVAGHAILKDPRRMIYDFEKDEVGVYCRRRFWLTAEAQRQHRIGNGIGFFFRDLADTALHRDPVTSSVFLAKSFLRAGSRGRPGLSRLWREQGDLLKEHLRTICAQAPASAPHLVRVAVARFFQKRRLPFLLPPAQRGRFPLFYQTEHMPNPESRVLLASDQKDDLGVPRLLVKIRFGERDFQTVRAFHREFQRRLRETGLGDFDYEDKTLAEQLENRRSGFNSNAHHIGTTRMSSQPEHGVVDTHGRIHGVANLFVAGSSVFPTSSHANPTLLALALALRQARAVHQAARHD